MQQRVLTAEYGTDFNNFSTEGVFVGRAYDEAVWTNHVVDQSEWKN